MNNHKNTIIRSTFATMSTDELKERIKQDCMADTRDQLDIDTILLIMEVIDEREKDAHSPSLDIDPIAAYDDFVDVRLAQLSQNSPSPKHIQKSKHPLRLRLLVAALVAVMACSITSSAFEWNFLQVFANWTESTFQFVTQIVTGAAADDADELHELREMVVSRSSIPLIPTWIPDGYEVADTQSTALTTKHIFWSTLSDGENQLVITITYHPSGIDEYARASEKEDSDATEYIVDGVSHYILINTDTSLVTWINGDFECIIQGLLSANDIEHMIESIYEG